MDPDEQLYELAAKELASSPRQGLLIKCMTEADGDEGKAKARYIKNRVKEMKLQIAKEAKEAKKQEQAERQDSEESEDDGLILVYFLSAMVLLALMIIMLSQCSPLL